MQSDEKAQAAWELIERLGGHGVWEPETVVVSLANSSVTDNDLSLFRDFPYVQTLDLSYTVIGNAGLSYLGDLPALEHLIIVQTKITESAVNELRRARPSLGVTTESPPKSAINPFTGKPF